MLRSNVINNNEITILENRKPFRCVLGNIYRPLNIKGDNKFTRLSGICLIGIYIFTERREKVLLLS